MALLVGEIEARAANTCAVDAMSVRSYYEAAFTQCFFLSGINGEELRIRVQDQLREFSGREAQLLAENIAVFDLSLEEVVPGPAQRLKSSNLEPCPKGLPLQNAFVLEATFSDGEPEHSKDLTSKSKAKAIPKAKALSSDQKAEFVISRLRESSSLRDIRPAPAKEEPVKEEPQEIDNEESVAETVPLEAPLDKDEVNELIRKEEENMQKARDRIAQLKRQPLLQQDPFDQEEVDRCGWMRANRIREENDANLQARYRELTRSRRRREEEIRKERAAEKEDKERKKSRKQESQEHGDKMIEAHSQRKKQDRKSVV